MIRLYGRDCLLISELDKLVKDLELLADLDRHISECHHRISRQRRLVAEMDGDSARAPRDPLPTARALLNNLIEAHALHLQYRERVRIAVSDDRL